MRDFSIATIVFGLKSCSCVCFRRATVTRATSFRWRPTEIEWTELKRYWVRYCTHYSGLGIASVHLFSSYFNHRMINSGIMLISISFNASIVWPLDFVSMRYCGMTIFGRFSIKFSSTGSLVIYFGPFRTNTHTLSLSSLAYYLKMKPLKHRWHSNSLYTSPRVSIHVDRIMYKQIYGLILFFFFVKDARTFVCHAITFSPIFISSLRWVPAKTNRWSKYKNIKTKKKKKKII